MIQQLYAPDLSITPSRSFAFISQSAPTAAYKVGFLFHVRCFFTLVLLPSFKRNPLDTKKRRLLKAVGLRLLFFLYLIGFNARP